MTDVSERWLPIPGWEGYYEVSDLGRVRSLDRMITRPTDGRVYSLRGKILKPAESGRRYLGVVLSRDGKQVTHSVHRLVAAAFLGPCPDGMETRHGPAGRFDNSVANLGYGTPAENTLDKIRDGAVLQGSALQNAKLTENVVRECRARYAAGGVTFQALADEFGVGIATMHRSVRGKRWKHVA